MTESNLETWTRVLQYLNILKVRTFIEFEANPRKILILFSKLFLVWVFLMCIMITISLINQTCFEDREIGTKCYINDHIQRDSECKPPTGGDTDSRFGYEKVNFLGIKTGRCFCCNGTQEDISGCSIKANNYPLIISIAICFQAVLLTSIFFGVKFKSKSKKMSVKTMSTFVDKLRTSVVSTNNFGELEKYLDADSTFVGRDNYVMRDKLRNLCTVPRSAFSYDSLGGKLGEGLFGIVYKGTYEEELGLLKVAIKTVKTNAGADSVKTFLNEINVMNFIGKHENIVGLLACCIEDFKTGKVYAILEYCCNGDLREFLKAAENKPAVKTSIEISSILEGYMTIKDVPSEEYTKSWQDVGKQLFPQFLKWAKEIAAGMDYLSGMKVLHVDLAARNVLLKEDLTALIGDFGLSRKLYCDYVEYDKTGMDPIPIKWVALESITENKYSTKSDVWSYGITLWEVFSFGKQPYSNLGVKELVSCLINGIRLPCPEHCNAEVFSKMSACWREGPDDRPTFKELHDYFENMLRKLTNNS